MQRLCRLLLTARVRLLPLPLLLLVLKTLRLVQVLRLTSSMLIPILMLPMVNTRLRASQPKLNLKAASFLSA